MKLSVLIPVYNEERFLTELVSRVVRKNVSGVEQKEIIIVDDCSTDKTPEAIENIVKKYPGLIISVRHEKNKGKGSALRTAIGHMTGDICIIQDADLEYDPNDYDLVLEPLIEGRADCVYGSRFSGASSKRVLFFWHSMGNKFLTLASNMFTNLNLTDMETCYKAFRCEILKSIPIRSDRFGFEPEITAKIAKRRCRIFEVGISYNGRTYGEGKKITWKDGVQAFFCIIRFWMIDDSVKNPQ